MNRTEEPPSRPAPPPARPVTRPSAAPISDSAGEHDWDPDRAGFSDIFGVTSPVGNDVPISLSSGSLVGLGTFSEDKMKETSNPPSPEIEDQVRMLQIYQTSNSYFFMNLSDNLYRSS